MITKIYTRKAVTAAQRHERVDSDGQKSDSHAGEYCRIFGDERGQLWVRGFELFNGLFQFMQSFLNAFRTFRFVSNVMR